MFLLFFNLCKFLNKNTKDQKQNQMITRLQINQLRNLSQINLAARQCNLIVGVNGSGKTSLLEGIFLLSRGKSFRNHQPSRYIQHGQTHATVFARLRTEDTLAIQKAADTSTLLRYNHQPTYGQSQLAKRLPVLLIDPASMDMLEQGSSQRRQMLDWLAFHVFDDFYPQWLAYQRLLKQRNTLLRQGVLSQIKRQELMAWDKQLAEHAQIIHQQRTQIFEKWQTCFAQSLAQLLPNHAQHIYLHYQAGYDTQHSLAELLAARIDQDLQLGHTRIGSHRSDVQVLWQKTDNTLPKPLKEPAVHVLSRGEKKLLITALRLSQIPLLTPTDPKDQQKNAQSVIVLLDDITAELDQNARKILLENLARLPCQVFITSLQPTIADWVKTLWSDLALFQIQQGQITPWQG